MSQHLSKIGGTVKQCLGDMEISVSTRAANWLRRDLSCRGFTREPFSAYWIARRDRVDSGTSNWPSGPKSVLESCSTTRCSTEFSHSVFSATATVRSRLTRTISWRRSRCSTRATGNLERSSGCWRLVWRRARRRTSRSRIRSCCGRDGCSRKRTSSTNRSRNFS